MVNPDKAYEGGPCKNCGGRLRWRRNRTCVACDRDRNRGAAKARYERLTGPEYSHLLLQHRRAKALTRMDKRNERTTNG